MTVAQRSVAITVIMGADCVDSMDEIPNSNITNIEQVIIGQLSNVSREIAAARTDIAVNTNETKNIGLQVMKVNGSVAEHQKDIQILKEQAIATAEAAKEAIRYTEQLKGEAKASQILAEAREKRISALENWRWYVLGVTGAALFFFGLYLRAIHF